jgi:hypothetical protein
MTFQIEKAWDGNECESEVNGRIYVSRGRWQFVLLHDGQVVEAFDRQGDAKFRAAKMAGVPLTWQRKDGTLVAIVPL